MLRVFKVTSPMSAGSWLLAGDGPVAGAAAASAVTGRLPRAGAAATAAAGVLGPAIATYTAALLANTAVPAWHDGHREMPYLFAGSAASAALPANLRGLLDDQGLDHLDHGIPGQSYTIAQALGALSWLVGRNIPPAT